MRIAIVTETYLPQLNGVSRTLSQLVRELHRRGHSVLVVHPDYGEIADEAEHATLPSVRLPFYKEVRVPRPPYGRATRALDAFRPDLVHIATEAVLGLRVLLHCHARGWKAVSSFHTNFDQYSDHYRVGWARGIIWRYLRWFHNSTLETYVPSKATISGLDLRGFERLRLWPRGVDGLLFRPNRPGRREIRERLGLGPDDVLIGHVSRLAVEKNVEYLGAALSEAARLRPGTRFLIVGDGPSRPELEARLGDAALLVGYQTGDDLADYYSAADVFAFASVTETFGNVVLEALASGLPVVAIRAGGVGEIVCDGETGIFIEQGEPPINFARALVHLADDPTRRRQLAENARAYARQQTWEAIHGQLIESYSRVIETVRPGQMAWA